VSTKPVLVQVITRLIVGGAQLSVLGLCEALVDDFDVRIVCGPQSGPEGSLHDRAAAIAPLTIVPSLVREISPRNDAAAVLSLRRTYARLHPDLVHTHSSKAGILGRLAASGGSFASVHTVHGWGHTPRDSAARRRLFVMLERVAARKADALIAVSAEVRREGLQLGIGAPNRYCVIAPLVDYEPQTPEFGQARREARGRLGVPDDADVVGWVGRFVEQKDPAALCSAVAAVLSSRPTARAVLVGDGPLRELVRGRLAAAEVLDRVVMAGLRPDARALMPAFDVLLHPSGWEGQPRVIHEALAERIPVVATNVSGTRDLVENGRTGYLVEPGDSGAMAARALAVLDDPALRAPLAPERLSGLAERFGRARVEREHRSLYRSLLGDG
jgi:glycosyltransferase involved in cell wall biosynthesis